MLIWQKSIKNGLLLNKLTNMDRRKALKVGVIGSLAGLSFSFEAKAKEENYDTKIQTNINPIVISTWNHGLAANEAAFSILKTGGKALDAIEKGLRVTEADISNRSVGIGGMPDRDGHVTLDACIMDEEISCFFGRNRPPYFSCTQNHGRNSTRYACW